jgi:tetratricopeptide (TPR) repeat protein
MIPRRVSLAAVVLSFVVPTVLSAQQLADAQSRREAVQYYRVGQEFFTAEKFDRAAGEFTKATAKDPLFTLAYYQTGQSYMNLKRYASAIQAFTRCIDATRTLHGLAETNRFAVEKQRDDEVREMRETVRVLQQSGHQLLAMRAEQHLLDLDKQRSSVSTGYQPPAEVLLSLGSAYFRSGDRDAAETQWKAAVAVNGKLGEAHNNLAAVYLQTGRYTEADVEIRAAEKSGFRVNPQLKEDVKKALARR